MGRIQSEMSTSRLEKSRFLSALVQRHNEEREADPQLLRQLASASAAVTLTKTQNSSHIFSLEIPHIKINLNDSHPSPFASIDHFLIN